MKKLTFLILLIGALFTTPIWQHNAVQADTQENLTINFKDFKFTTTDYKDFDVSVNYYQVGLTEVADIIENQTGQTLESIKVIPNLFRSGHTYSHTLSRSASFGRTTLQLDVHVEIYTNGSFRQINSVQGHYLGITNFITNTSIEGKDVSVWSSNGFPTTELKYAYSGTLVATINSGFNAGIKGELFQAGFHMSGDNHYRLPFNRNGSISLY
ncbi:hypothetical protein [Streptococcus marmotae]|uniref:hypothetical protein n=1 Tax=Streptococcus marmotae TaxID=1825069 RepID=UPI0008315B88|nr:hypothetical protein [Streptococcus marmotae]